MENTKSRFPACLIIIPSDSSLKGTVGEARPDWLCQGRRRAAFYLAAEEYVAAQLPADNYLFSWVLPPTVVFGRNQVAQQELNIDFCRAQGIDMIRRKSGGGCIYADTGNIMWSLVTSEGAVEPIFADYADSVAAALTTMGIAAKVSGRNDITLADGGKVCGNAFYHLAHSNIAHGTMLYDTNAENMVGALHPATAKLEAKGVKSVRSRISLIKNVRPIGVEALRKGLEDILTDRHITLTPTDVAAIIEIEGAYYDDDYRWGRHDRDDLVIDTGRIEGCGHLQLHLATGDGVVEGITLTGDFFATGHATEAFAKAFVGLPATVEAFCQAVDTHHPETTIRSLTAEQIKNCFERGLK